MEKPPLSVPAIAAPRHHSSLFSQFALVVLACALCLSAEATTVIAPEFDSLVQQADFVVRGTVTSVNSEWRVQNGHRNIVTFVSIDVTETIAGNPPTPLVLQMLGGKIGDKHMIVEGSPAFVVGDEHILFIRGNGVQFNPLVALMHGQYPIKKDATGQARVTRSDGSPLRDENEVSLPMESRRHVAAVSSSQATSSPAASSAESPALTTAEFASRIRTSRQKAASTHAK